LIYSPFGPHSREVSYAGVEVTVIPSDTVTDDSNTLLGSAFEELESGDRRQRVKDTFDLETYAPENVPGDATKAV
jgi:hypothetical protein